MPKKRRKKTWSYNAGERGRNWVRAFCQSRDGKFYLEFREDGRRRAVLLRGVTEHSEAKAKADELAAQFSGFSTPPGPLTVRSLMAAYTKEVTPTKKNQDHDWSASRIWPQFLDSQLEVARRASRHPSSLDRVDWDRFVSRRRVGDIGRRGPVKDRAVQRDLKWMIAVLNWAVGASLLRHNPWNTEVRRAQRWVMPREKNPSRPSVAPEIREGLIAHAPSWQFSAMLILERETRRRNSAIRQLLWSDIDQENWTVRWRCEADKNGQESVTPLTSNAIEVLKELPSRGIGLAPVFPAGGDPSQSTPHQTCQTWLQRAKTAWLKNTSEDERAALRKALHRVGFHSELRAGVRDADFRKLPAKVQEEFSGKSFAMLTSTYDEVTVDDMRSEGEAIGIPRMAPRTVTIASTNREQEG